MLTSGVADSSIMKACASDQTVELRDLPTELHFAVFSFLDKLDSTCLGLTNKHFYAIHRDLNGVVPLSTQRPRQPNDLEWVWAVAQRPSKALHPKPSSESRIEEPSARGNKPAGYCDKCGFDRCILQRHLRGWTPSHLEYCEITERLGPQAPTASPRSSCYRCSPRNKNLCGRHGKRTLNRSVIAERLKSK